MKIKRKEANKQATKFCKQCFEAGKQHCDCLLNKLDSKERALADSEREFCKGRGSKDESSFCPEFLDDELSHDFSMSLGPQSAQKGSVSVVPSKKDKNRQSVMQSKNKDL